MEYSGINLNKFFILIIKGDILFFDKLQLKAKFQKVSTWGKWNLFEVLLISKNLDAALSAL